jgi:LytS/YehU family sensor histidine kinase
MQGLTAAPVYWLLVGLGTLVQFSREHEANRTAEIELRHSLAIAQLDALKMKLQPHFLFNALNAIAALVRVGETAAVVRTVEHLGTLLRLSMETSARQLVPLDQEMALVDAYLAIEEVRFGDRLRVVRRIAPDARRALVPNLILQPLVENALVHGLSRRLDASLLELAARRDGSQLRIAVRDDGPGLPSTWSLAANAGAGLKNVADRLQGLFPGSGGLTMENGATGGAVALLSLPFADAETTAVAVEREPWTA